MNKEFKIKFKKGQLKLKRMCDIKPLKFRK